MMLVMLWSVLEKEEQRAAAATKTGTHKKRQRGKDKLVL
jgi:hypothetical protein